MPIVFPTDLFDYFNEGGAGGMKVYQRLFDISDPRSMQETVGGEAIIGTYGTNLWYGSITVVPQHNALQRPLEAKVRSLQRPDARFFVRDALDDPLVGNIAGAVIGTVNGSNNYNIRIDGLPAGFVLPAGTRLSYDFAGKRAYHEVASRAGANASGQCTVTVFPVIQPGWVAGTPVRFNTEAACYAGMIPKSLKTGQGDATTSQGFSFSWRQTLETRA